MRYPGKKKALKQRDKWKAKRKAKERKNENGYRSENGGRKAKD